MEQWKERQPIKGTLTSLFPQWEAEVKSHRETLGKGVKHMAHSVLGIWVIDTPTPVRRWVRADPGGRWGSVQSPTHPACLAHEQNGFPEDAKSTDAESGS